MARAERTTGLKLQFVQLGGAGEHKDELVSVL